MTTTDRTDWKPIKVLPEGHTAVPTALIEELRTTVSETAFDALSDLLAAVDGGEAE